MNEYVDKLIDCLDIYMTYINNHPNMTTKQEIIKLFQEEVIALKNIKKTGGNIGSYDFKSLKKHYSILFHPDIFKAEGENDIDFGFVTGITNGTLDSITKMLKGGGTFYYNTATGDAYKNSGYSGSNNYANANGNNYYYSQQSNNKYGQYNYNYQGTSSRKNSNKAREKSQYYKEEYYYEDDLPPYIVTFIQERFDYYFKGIPSSEEEYDSLLNKYEATIKDLSEHIAILTQLLKMQEDKEKNDYDTYMFAISEGRLNAVYRSMLSEYQQKVNDSFTKQQAAKQNLDNIVVAKDDEIRQQINDYWEKRNSFITDFNQKVWKLQQIRTLYPWLDVTNLCRDIENRKRYIDIYYSNSNNFYSGVHNYVYTKDSSYDEARKIFEQSEMAFQDALSRLESFKEEASSTKKKLVEDAKREYKRTELKNSVKKESLLLRKNFISKKLERVKAKRRKLIDEYSQYFGEKKKR